MNGAETVLSESGGIQDTNDSETVMTETLINSYFSHNNVLSKSIISEKRSLIKFLGDQWNELDCQRSEALLDLLFVEDDIRQQLTSFKNDDVESIKESFPRLYLNSGQKINVDFENDLWTWRDEHSGPFSWMSRSQQDLTLTDLETENISKPQPKTLRVDTENPDNLKEAEHQFSNPANCWSRDIIDNYRKAERKITLSPCASIEFEFKKQPVEEASEACEDTNENTPSSMPNKDKDIDSSKLESQEVQDVSSDSLHKRKNSGKDRRKRSPSPKKILRSSSLRRSPSKCSDQGEQQLISKKSDDSYEEQNSFSNPLVETQWSSFVGENGTTEQEKDAIPMKTVHTYNFPTSQVMDRGAELSSRGSPYQVQRDNVNLITPSESPVQNQRGHNLYTATNELEGWSAESTPDHTTHLLKGMEKDKAKDPDPSLTKKITPSAYEGYEKDEVLTVKSHGNDITISTEPESENKRDSDIPCSGFDFLDNW